MSTLSYEVEYQQVLNELNELNTEDASLVKLNIRESPKDRYSFFLHTWAALYLRYSRLASRLSIVHDLTLQPQKIHDVRTLLDSCLARMLEIKDFVVKECGDFLPLDNFMMDLKLSPEQAETPVPPYFVQDREEELLERRNYVRSLQEFYADNNPEAPISVALALPAARSDPTKALAPMATKKPPPPPQTDESDEPLPLEEAVRVLQICERGRQARQRARFQMAMYKQQQHVALHGQSYNTVTGKDRASTVIQKVVLGYLERKRAAQRYEGEKHFLGLVPDPEAMSAEPGQAAMRRAQERKARQRMNLAELQQKTAHMASQIRAKEGPKSMEEMLDEILMHMTYARMECKDGSVPEFPTAEEGGSLKLLGKLGGPKSGGKRRSLAKRRSRSFSVNSGATGGANTETNTAAGDGGTAANQSSARRNSNATQANNASVGESKSVAGGGGGKKKKKKEEEKFGEPVPPSVLWGNMAEANGRYDTLWREKFVNSYLGKGDLDQPADEGMIRQQLLEGPCGIVSELRKCVDELVMMEVANLKERLELEKNAKRKKKKKAKKPKKPKKPRLKDPTKGVDLETQFNTLIFDNKVQLPPQDVRVAHFIGPENVMATPLDAALRSAAPDEAIKKKWQRILRNWNDKIAESLRMKKEDFEALFAKFQGEQASWLYTPSAWQIRNAIKDYGVLPLGSQVVHDLAPHASTMLLYGFPHSGKSMMTYALCNESGANFFNLSPANFPVLKGIAKAIQLVFYVARMKSPSVIYIENVEKIFPERRRGRKKDPLATRGKKMKKELLKSMKTLQPTDRVLVVGATSAPWQSKNLPSFFQRAVYFPLPDYATRLELLQSFVRQRLPESTTEIPFSAALEHMAYMTDGLSVGQLQQLVERTLHPRRVERLSQRPLEAEDFVPALSILKAPTKEDMKSMESFHHTLPTHMRRANPPEDFLDEEEAEKRAKQKGGSSGKGKKPPPKKK